MCSTRAILRASTLAAVGLLVLNASLTQRAASADDVESSPAPPAAGAAPSASTSAEDALQQCASLARTHRVVPGRSWGSLTDELRTQWRELACDSIVTPDVLLDRRAASAEVELRAVAPARIPPLRTRARQTRRLGGAAVSVYGAGMGGYRVFRIPALARASRMLLAFAEARPTVDDNGSIDIVLRRSTDGGRSWGPLLVVVKGGAWHGEGAPATFGNPVPMWLRREGVLLLLFCSNAADVSEDAIRDGKGGVGRRVWMTKSLDAGANWTTPLELTFSVKPAGWTWYATGPGGAIVTRNGTLVVPATHADGEGPIGSGKDHSHVLLSNDRGETWRVGGVATAHTNEATVAQLADDSLLLNARDVSPNRR